MDIRLGRSGAPSEPVADPSGTAQARPPGLQAAREPAHRPIPLDGNGAFRLAGPLTIQPRRPDALTLASVAEARAAALRKYGRYIDPKAIPPATSWLILPSGPFERLAGQMYERYEISKPQALFMTMDGASFMAGSWLTGNRPLVILREMPFNRITSVAGHELCHCATSEAFTDAIHEIGKYLPCDLREGFTEYLNWQAGAIGRPRNAKYPFQAHAQQKAGGLVSHKVDGTIAERIALEAGGDTLERAYFQRDDSALAHLLGTIHYFVEEGLIHDFLD